MWVSPSGHLRTFLDATANVGFRRIQTYIASVDKVSSRSHSLSGDVGPCLECCNGPSIEGHYDEALSVLGLVDQILDGSAADVHVIGYFGERGLQAARKSVRPCRAHMRNPPPQ